MHPNRGNPPHGNEASGNSGHPFQPPIYHPYYGTHLNQVPCLRGTDGHVAAPPPRPARNNCPNGICYQPGYNCIDGNCTRVNQGHSTRPPTPASPPPGSMAGTPPASQAAAPTNYKHWRP